MQDRLGLGLNKISGNFKRGSGGVIDPDAQAQINRIQADGGTIENQQIIIDDIVFLKSIGLYSNWRYAVDPVCGIAQRVDGSDIFVPKIYDYAPAKTGGIYADTANGTAIEQPKKGILNGKTSLDFDGVDDRLINVDGVSFPSGTEMFTLALYSFDFMGSDRFGMVVDKYSPDTIGKNFGKGRDFEKYVYDSQIIDGTPYNNVQILASGTSTTSNVLTGYVNEQQVSQETLAVDSVGVSLGAIRNRTTLFYAKAQFQKKWDFNIIPTPTQIQQVYTYWKNQKNINYVV